VVTRYKDVKEVLDHHTEFSVRPYQPVMDASVGPFMLAHENTAVNAEKPGMRAALYGSEAQYKEKIRAVVKHLTLEAIAEGTKGQQLDVVKAVTRNVPLGLNDEYFGFPGPDMKTMAKWSRATQYAFFHNPLQDNKINKDAIAAGAEMTAYIHDQLIPEKTRELASGRPASDTVSILIQVAKQHAKYGLTPDRLITDTMGLLVGSVETTSAAVVQALEYMLNNPEVLQKAIEASRSGNDELLAKITWEALRFHPVNPWLARWAEKDMLIAAGTDHATVIPKGSLVLASTESAMWDEEVVSNPQAFDETRDQSQFMHLGYEYHRCLGDDVALIMVPEMIKQLVLLPGISKTSVDETVDFHGKDGPFPESFVVNYEVPRSPTAQDSVGKEVAQAATTDWDMLKNYLVLGDLIINRIVHSPDPMHINATIAESVAGDPKSKQAALEALPDIVNNAMAGQDKYDACMNKNFKSREVFPDFQDRSHYCQVRLDFRGCYFVQRILAKQSSYSAYYQCAYHGSETYLSSQERADFKDKFAHMDLFYFLNWEGH